MNREDAFRNGIKVSNEWAGKWLAHMENQQNETKDNTGEVNNE